MSKRIFLSIVAIVFAVIVHILVGTSDLLALLWLGVAVYIMKLVVLQFQMGGRRLLSNHFKTGAEADEMLNKPGVFQHILSYLGALFIALGLFVLLKGVSLNHGIIPVAVIIGISALLIFPHLRGFEKQSAEHEIVENSSSVTATVYNQLSDKTAVTAELVSRLLFLIIVLNAVLAIFLSAKDTMSFMTSSVDFYNFDQMAVQSSVEFNGQNKWSRVILNAYIVADSVKLALANGIFDSFMPTAEKLKYFYVFYFLTFLMNLIKLTPLSIGVVILLAGLRYRLDLLRLVVNKIANLTGRGGRDMIKRKKANDKAENF